MKQSVGSWVEGDDFFGRDGELELFMEKLERGESQLLTGQRRLGKTSLLRETKRRLGDGVICLYIDFQGCSTPMDAITELGKAVYRHRSVWDKVLRVFPAAAKLFRDNVDSVNIGEIGLKIRDEMTEGDWSDKGDQLLEIMSKAEKNVVILMDELPILVGRILMPEGEITTKTKSDTDVFMSWLRENVLRHKGRLVFAVAGSIGLEPILRLARMSATLNVYSPFELKPWDKETAVACLDELAKNSRIEFRDDAQREMVEKLGCCIPHHVQLFFQKAYDKCSLWGDMAFYASEVEELYREGMLCARGHAELAHYEERLTLVFLKETLPVAQAILTETSISGKLTAGTLAGLREVHGHGAEAQRAALEVLEHDGYLVKRGGEYVFDSNLLRDWWKGKYEDFHTPVSKRGA